MSCARQLGLSRNSRLNVALEHILERDLAVHFDGDTPDLTRRQLITMRTRLSELIRLEPIMAGSGVIVDRVVPSWRHLREVVNIARGGYLT